MRVQIFLPLLFGFLASTAQSEYSALYQKQTSLSSDQLGRSVAGAGDVNGDGFADFIIGASGASPNGINHSGSAFVYSGTDGSLLFQKDGAEPYDEFGWAVGGAGDVNADGKADFIIGARFAAAGKAYIYSGADGSLLYEKTGLGTDDEFGFSVAGAGDVNGDGKSDFIVGARWARPDSLYHAGQAYVFSGADGSLLYQVDGAAAGDWLGYSVAGVGDANLDGRADFLVGAPLANPGGRADAGSASLYSGMDGTLLQKFDGQEAGDLLGVSVGGSGGRCLAGAPYANRDGKTEAGIVFVFSGQDGSLLFEKRGEAAFDYLGWAVASAGDVNADGSPDFMVAAPFSNPNGVYDGGVAYVFSGADGSLLFQKAGTWTDGQLGWSLSGAGDVNGDGGDDFILGAPGANSASVYVACAAGKGDLNASGHASPADLVLGLLCFFSGRTDCQICSADLNCDGLLTLPDIVSELNLVFLGTPPPC